MSASRIPDGWKGLDIGPEQAEALRKALPDCLVSWWRKPKIEYPEAGRRGGN